MKLIKKHAGSFVLIITAFLFLWPLLWLLIASFDAKAPLSMRLPENFTLENYKSVVSDTGNMRAFLNSFVISFSQSALVVFLAILAAYPLSRFRMKNKNSILYSLLFLTGLPITAVMVPVYLMFFQLMILNSLASTTLFLAATALPYSIWMMKNFIDDVPVALEEAAWVDGAGTLTAIRRVILPVMLPGISVVFIFTFSASWGNFFVPFILINAMEKMPAAVMIYQFLGPYGSVAYGELAAFSLMYTMPIAFLYLLSQKFMSGGFRFGGAVK